MLGVECESWSATLLWCGVQVVTQKSSSMPKYIVDKSMAMYLSRSLASRKVFDDFARKMK